MIAEAACILLLLDWAASGRLEVVWSGALDFECNQRIPRERLAWAQWVRTLTRRCLRPGSSELAHARELSAALRLSALDALHVACAESAGAVLVSVDLKLLRRCGRRPETLRTLVIDPMEAAGRERSGRWKR